MSRARHRWRRPDDATPAYQEGALALGVAFGGTLILGQLVGAESEWELLLLLGAVAGAGFLLERGRMRADARRRLDERDPPAV